MPDVQVEIHDWLLKQQNWLQEAADRLLRQGALTPADFDEICGLLKTKAGQAISTHRSFEGLLGIQHSAEELRLMRSAVEVQHTHCFRNECLLWALSLNPPRDKRTALHRKSA